MKQLAKIISVVSNPLIVSLPFCFALIFKSRGDFSYAVLWTIISGVFAGIVGLFVSVGVKRGFFSDYDVSVRKQRPPLFAFAGIMSILYFVLVLYLNGPRILLIGLAALILGIVIAEIINTKIKASIHLAVFSAFSIVVGLLYGGWFWALLLTAPVVAWSRIVLKRHQLAETVVGSTFGISIVFISYLVVKYLIIR